MKCPHCKTPMMEAQCDGQPSWFCRACGKVAYRQTTGLMDRAGAPGQGQGNPESAISGRTPTDTLPRPQTRSQGQPGASLSEPSAGERLFSEEWEARYPEVPFVTEYRFHTFRDWQIDFAWPAARVCVEMEGMDHRKAQRYAGDLAKYNALADGDWALYRCTMKTLNSDADRFCRMVAEKITKRLKEF